MKKATFYKTAFYILLLLPLIGLGQTGTIGPVSKVANLPEIIPPSPSVASLMKLEEIPVDNYSGTPDISFPLYSFALEGGLSVNAGLNYSSTGVMVDNLPGWAGAGWALNCGGSISRTMVDTPDELEKGVLINGFEGLSAMSEEQQEVFLWTANRDSWDTESDLFQFSFMGRTGRFTLSKSPTTGVISVVDLSGDNKLKITFVMGTDGPHSRPIQSFTIVDDFGYIYTFGAIEKTSSTSTSDTANAMLYNSAWNLTKVESPDRRVLCTFTYDIMTESYITPWNMTFNDMLKRPRSRPDDAPPFPILDAIVQSFNIMNVGSCKLNTANIPGKGSISFTSAARTQDLYHPLWKYNGYKLVSAIIKDPAGATIKTFNFTMNSTLSGSNKMFLTGIDEVYSPSKKLSYKFNYKGIFNFPKYGSFNKDYWGYYNGSNNQLLAPILGANRESNETYALQGGILESIEYPNGGIKTFTFELNTFSYIGSRPLDPMNPNEIPENRAFQLKGFNYASNGITSSETIYVATKQFVTFGLTARSYSTTTPAGKNDIAGTEVRIIALIPPATAGGSYTDGAITVLNIYHCSALPTLDQNHIIEVTSCSRTVELSGYYRIEIGTATSGYVASMPAGFNFNYTYFNMVPTYKIAKGGGLRIKKVELRDKTQIKSTLLYDYNRPEDPQYSSGSQSMVAKKQSYIIKPSLFVLDSHQQYHEGFFWIPELYAMYRVYDDQSGLDIPLTKGNYVGYKNVTVTRTEPVTPPLATLALNGRSEYTYTSMLDFDDNGSSEAALVQYPFARPTSYDYKRGLLLLEKTFDSNNRLLQKNAYDYAYSERLQGSGFTMKNKIDCECPSDLLHLKPEYTAYKTMMIQYFQNDVVYDPDRGINMWNDYWTNRFFPDGNPENAAPFNCVRTKRYLHFLNTFQVSGFAQMIEKRSESYSYPTQAATPFTVTAQKEQYQYDTNNGQIYQYTNVLSPTESVITRYFYPDGISDTNTAYSSADLAVINLMRKDNQHRISVPIEVQTKKTTAAGQLFRDAPFMTTQRTLYKNWNTTTGLILPWKVQVSKGAGALIDRLVYDSVDPDNGNILKVSQDYQSTSYVWGYNKTLPIAKIDGVAPTTALVNAAVTASNGTSEQAVIDALEALRTGSPNSAVTTLTHKPGWGVSTVTDPTGYRLFYDYDELLRLKAVKDKAANGTFNVLSANQYNYKAILNLAATQFP